MMKSTCRIALRAALWVISLFATSVAAFTPQTGQWWNPNESGTGYNLDIHNGVLVATVFSYKTNGDSEWYLAGGPMSADQRQFSGRLDKFRNGQCISCPYPGLPTNVGNDGAIFINFITETSATVQLPGGRVTTIQPLYPLTSGSGTLDGTYRLTRTSIDFLHGQLFDTSIGNIVATGTMVISGNQLTQLITVTLSGTTNTVSISGTFVDYGAYMVLSSNTTQSRATVISRNGPLITEAIVAIGTNPPSAEVDQWEFVSAKIAISSHGDDDSVPLGGALGTLIMR